MKRIIILQELSEDPSSQELIAAKEMIEFIMAVNGYDDMVLDLHSQISSLIRKKILCDNFCSRN